MLYGSVLNITVKSRDFENNYIIILIDLIAFIFFIFTIYFSLIIALIDVEAKRGIHYVYGCAIKLSDKQALFSVCMIIYYRSHKFPDENAGE